MLLHYLVKQTSPKQAINNKLQGTVATYLRRGEVFNKQIKKGLLLSLWMKNFFNRWIFTTKNEIVSCTFLVFSSVLARRAKCKRQ